jgi:GAF domain-containing protein
VEEVNGPVMDQPPPVGPVHRQDGLVGRLLDVLVEMQQAQQLLDEITGLCVERIAGVTSASITTITREGPKTVASSDEVARAIDAAQYAGGVGPCLRSAATDRIQQIDDTFDDVDDDGQPPEPWRLAARMRGVGAALAMPIPAAPDMAISLNMYSTHAGWAQQTLDAAEDLATYAGDALVLARRLEEQRQLEEQLQGVLRSRAVMERAVGVMMAWRRCSAEAAWQLLVEASRQEGTTLQAAAERILQRVGPH